MEITKPPKWVDIVYSLKSVVAGLNCDHLMALRPKHKCIRNIYINIYINRYEHDVQHKGVGFLLRISSRSVGITQWST